MAHCVACRWRSRSFRRSTSSRVLGTQKRDGRNMFATACCKLAPGIIDRNRIVNHPVAAIDGRVDDAEFRGPAVQGLRVERFLTAASRGPAVRRRPEETPRMRRIAARTASVSAAWTIATPRSRFISAASSCPEGSSSSGVTPLVGYIRFHISRHERNSSSPSESRSLVCAVSQEAPPGACGLACRSWRNGRHVADRAQGRGPVVGMHGVTDGQERYQIIDYYLVAHSASQRLKELPGQRARQCGRPRVSQ
jgi:hypothetical protein